MMALKHKPSLEYFDLIEYDHTHIQDPLQPMHACLLSCFSHVQLFTTLWTVACQAPLSMGFSGQEYWSGLPCTPPRDLPDSTTAPTAPVAPALQADSLLLSHQGSPQYMHKQIYIFVNFNTFPLISILKILISPITSQLHEAHSPFLPLHISRSLL